MTHYELLKRIKDFFEVQTMGASKMYEALCAAVKLHKPFLFPEDDLLYCEEDNQPYPCGTIQFIEKEMK